jgi:hypothetical protein
MTAAVGGLRRVGVALVAPIARCTRRSPMAAAAQHQATAQCTTAGWASHSHSSPAACRCPPAGSCRRRRRTCRRSSTCHSLSHRHSRADRRCSPPASGRRCRPPPAAAPPESPPASRRSRRRRRCPSTRRPTPRGSEPPRSAAERVAPRPCRAHGEVRARRRRPATSGAGRARSAASRRQRTSRQSSRRIRSGSSVAPETAPTSSRCWHPRAPWARHELVSAAAR